MPVPEVDDNKLFVLDGGSLLYCLPWPKDSEFGVLCSKYVDFIQRNYTPSIIVFDGYGTASTKDMVHLRRSGGVVGTVDIQERRFSCKSGKKADIYHHA